MLYFLIGLLLDLRCVSQASDLLLSDILVRFVILQVDFSRLNTPKPIGC